MSFLASWRRFVDFSNSCHLGGEESWWILFGILPVEEANILIYFEIHSNLDVQDPN